MNALVARESFSKRDKRAIIKFHVLLGRSPHEIHAVMQEALGDASPSYETIRRWVLSIREGKEDLDDEPRSGRPASAHSDDLVTKLEAAVREDRRITVRQLSDALGVSTGSVHSMLTEKIGMRKVCAKWVPHILTEDQRGCRVSICSSHLCRHRREGLAFLERIVACDETWAHSWEPELKRQSATWCRPGSPRPEKAHRAMGQLKVMHITFFDRFGILYDEAVPTGQTVNGDYCLSVLRKVLRAIRMKRPALRDAGVDSAAGQCSPSQEAKCAERD